MQDSTMYDVIICKNRSAHEEVHRKNSCPLDTLELRASLQATEKRPSPDGCAIAMGRERTDAAHVEIPN